MESLLKVLFQVSSCQPSTAYKHGIGEYVISSEEHYGRAQAQLAIDPDAVLSETRQVWEEAMLSAYSKVRAVADAIGRDYQVLDDFRVRLTGPAHPDAATLPEDWLRAFYLTMVLRDRKRCQDLCRIAPGIVAHVAQDGTPRGSARSRNWIDALQSYILDIPGFVPVMRFLMRNTWGDDPFLRRHDTTGTLLSTMKLLFALECYDPEVVEEHLTEALAIFTAYRDQAREAHPEESVPAFPLELIALACRAQDMAEQDEDFTFELTSPLLPAGIVRNAWAPDH
ncbi:hypothetical protein GCM10009603_64540 [Nocardiopsis exhalans]